MTTVVRWSPACNNDPESRFKTPTPQDLPLRSLRRRQPILAMIRTRSSSITVYSDRTRPMHRKNVRATVHDDWDCPSPQAHHPEGFHSDGRVLHERHHCTGEFSFQKAMEEPIADATGAGSRRRAGFQNGHEYVPSMDSLSRESCPKSCSFHLLKLSSSCAQNHNATSSSSSGDCWRPPPPDECVSCTG